MNNQQYRAMVDDVCEQLPGNWQRIGSRMVKQLPGAGAPVYLTLQFPQGDNRQGMQIIYRRHDAYIMGYVTTAGQAYAAHNQMGNVPNAIDLTYKDDYATLGWNRQGPSVNTANGPTVSVAQLDMALNSAAVGAVNKIGLCRMVLALAEGVRFMDVERAVRGNLPINTQMVDWAQQLAEGMAVLKQG